jgi:UDP:flavonoid glycosyltransferase YjiC (YdhE family)
VSVHDVARNASRCGDGSRQTDRGAAGALRLLERHDRGLRGLRHAVPHADVFVTNGGFGGLLAAMRHGVPVVGAGKTEGKNDIDARIGYNRLGVDLGSERPRPARIRAAVRHVLADPRFAANVAELRAELESYDPMARIEAALHDEMLTAQP